MPDVRTLQAWQYANPLKARSRTIANSGHSPQIRSPATSRHRSKQCVRILVVTGGSGVGKTEQRIARLAQRGKDLCVLEGQVSPAFVRAAFAQSHVDGHMMLLDCAHDTREARLRDDRGQPALITRDMACRGSYLRGQADALNYR